MDLKSIKQWNLATDNIIIYSPENKIKAQNLDDVDFSKPGILIIDDNEGICSFIEDDLEEMDEDGMIVLADYNVFVFSSIMCAYNLIATIQKYSNLNIQKAIIDITYSGTVSTISRGNIKLNGVDVFEILYEMNENIKYLFYTGNQMNKNIKNIGELMVKYTAITNNNIKDNIIFKTQHSMKERRLLLQKKIFDE